MALTEVTLDPETIKSCTVDGVEVRCTGFTLEQNNEIVRTDLPDMVPDHGWSFVDDAGHFHAWDYQGQTPTLESVSKGRYYCESCDEDEEETYLRCVECQEEVEPQRKDSGRRSISMPGQRQYRILVDGRHWYCARQELTNKRLSVHITGEGLDLFGFMQVASALTVELTVNVQLVGQLHARAGVMIAGRTLSGTL